MRMTSLPRSALMSSTHLAVSRNVVRSDTAHAHTAHAHARIISSQSPHARAATTSMCAVVRVVSCRVVSCLRGGGGWWRGYL
jgi:hypothetical protein